SRRVAPTANRPGIVALRFKGDALLYELKKAKYGDLPQDGRAATRAQRGEAVSGQPFAHRIPVRARKLFHPMPQRPVLRLAAELELKVVDVALVVVLTLESAADFH